MANKRTKTLMEMMVPMILIGILAVVVTFYIAGSGSTSTVTKASRSTFLTPGDDILSLEADLKKLKTDPAVAQKAELDAIK